MHNLDRTNPEWGETMESFETFEQGESESGYETGTFGETFELNEVYGESPFNETQEMELAAELLEITNEDGHWQSAGRQAMETSDLTPIPRTYHRSKER